jgi:hypothetical protein
MELFGSKIAAQVSKNRILRILWRKTLPYKTRFRILQWFSSLSSDFSKRTEILISMLEEPNAYDFDKKEQVIEFLKKNKYGVISPEFADIWLEKDSASNKIFNFNGAFLSCTKDQYIETLSLLFMDTFMVSLLFNDDYSSGLVERLDKVKVPTVTSRMTLTLL